MKFFHQFEFNLVRDYLKNETLTIFLYGKYNVPKEFTAFLK